VASAECPSDDEDLEECEPGTGEYTHIKAALKPHRPTQASDDHTTVLNRRLFFYLGEVFNDRYISVGCSAVPLIISGGYTVCKIKLLHKIT